MVLLDRNFCYHTYDNTNKSCCQEAVLFYIKKSSPPARMDCSVKPAPQNNHKSRHKNHWLYCYNPRRWNNHKPPTRLVVYHNHLKKSMEESYKMQKLSFREFKNYCDKLSHCRFIFDSVNQDWCTVGETMKIKHDFDNLKISFNPNTVHLCSSLGKLIFERVKYIEMCEQSMLGAVFNIVCGDSSTNTCDKSYTIIVA